MAPGDLVRLFVSREGLCEALCPLKNSAKRCEGVEVLVVELDGAAQGRLARRGIGIHRLFRVLRDLVLNDAFLAPRFAVTRRHGSRLRELLQRFVPNLAITAQDFRASSAQAGCLGRLRSLGDKSHRAGPVWLSDLVFGLREQPVETARPGTRETGGLVHVSGRVNGGTIDTGRPHCSAAVYRVR